MTIEHEKTEAQERIAQELPEEVRTLPEAEELSDGELEGVNGGYRTPMASRDGKEAQAGAGIEAMGGSIFSPKDVIDATDLNVSSRDIIRQLMQNRK